MKPSDHTDRDRLDALVVVRLWALQVAFQARLDHALTTVGLTRAGFRLVGELMHAPDGLRQRELADRLGVKAPTVSVAISKLQELGVVERAEDPTDPRAWRVRLTAGAPVGAGVDLLEALEHDAVGPLTLDERRTLADLLTRVTHHLSLERSTP